MTMKKTGFFALCILIMAASCSRQQNPAGIARDFLQAFFSSDYQQAREYAAPELFEILDQTQAILDSLEEVEYEEVKSYLSAINITVEDPEEVTKDTVRLRYRVEFSRLPEPGESTLSLRKIKGTWKVYALD